VRSRRSHFFILSIKRRGPPKEVEGEGRVLRPEEEKTSREMRMKTGMKEKRGRRKRARTCTKIRKEEREKRELSIR